MGAVLAKPVIRERVWSEHAEILACVLAGDGVGAEKAARRHTERAGEEVARTFQDVASAA